VGGCCHPACPPRRCGVCAACAYMSSPPSDGPAGVGPKAGRLQDDAPRWRILLAPGLHPLACPVAQVPTKHSRPYLHANSQHTFREQAHPRCLFNIIVCQGAEVLGAHSLGRRRSCGAHCALSEAGKAKRGKKSLRCPEEVLPQLLRRCFSTVNSASLRLILLMRSTSFVSFFASPHRAAETLTVLAGGRPRSGAVAKDRLTKLLGVDRTVCSAVSITDSQLQARELGRPGPNQRPSARLADSIANAGASVNRESYAPPRRAGVRSTFSLSAPRACAAREAATSGAQRPVVLGTSGQPCRGIKVITPPL